MRDLPDRQHSLRAVFDHSWQLLTPRQCSLLHQIAVFPNSITAAEAAAVAGASLGDLAELVDRSWLHVGAVGHFAVRNVARRKLLLRTEWSAGPGNPSFLSLGDLNIGHKTLRLDCLSRERLALGRQLLEDLLNGLLIHKKDAFAAFDFGASAPASAPPPRARPLTDPGARQVERELLEREAQKWLNTPVPLLDNQSPLQAVQHPDGRAEVEEMLKVAEYYQDDGSMLRDSPLDVRNLRRALGLTD